MTDGRSDRWVKFHVKALNNPIFTDMTPAVVKVFMICLLEANWQDRKWWDGRSEVTVRRGSFPTSTLKLSKKYNLTRQELRSAFYNLQKVGSVTITATTHYTLVTVENYDTYQGGDDGCNQPNNQPVNQVTTNQQPANNQPTTTLLECLESVEENIHTPAAQAPPRKRVQKSKPNPEWEAWFAEWYAIYPRHIKRENAENAFKKLITNRELCDKALDAVHRKLGGIHGPDSEFYPYPATWLNSKPWRDLEDSPMLPLYSGPDPRMIL